MAEVSTDKRILRVKNPEQSPPGGWVWRDADSGQIITGSTLDLTVKSVTIFVGHRGGDTGDVEAEVHERTAKSLISKKLGHLVEYHGEVNRSAGQYLSGLTAVALSKWWSDSPIIGLIRGENSREGVHVSQDEADRRAAVCCGPVGGEPCEGNVIPTSKKWVQNWTDEKMLASVDGKKTDRHEDLGACTICSCELRAAVWWSAKITKASMRVTDYEKDLPAHCWKLNLNK